MCDCGAALATAKTSEARAFVAQRAVLDQEYQREQGDLKFAAVKGVVGMVIVVGCAIGLLAGGDGLRAGKLLVYLPLILVGVASSFAMLGRMRRF